MLVTTGQSHPSNMFYWTWVRFILPILENYSGDFYLVTSISLASLGNL